MPDPLPLPRRVARIAFSALRATGALLFVALALLLCPRAILRAVTLWGPPSSPRRPAWHPKRSRPAP